MKVYERKYEHLGYLCGIDEVGRGPLAGPVVACAVVLPRDCQILYLNDSKKLTAAKRDELYDVIMKEAVSVGIGMRGPGRIDEINILQATYEAMREAVANLKVTPQLLLNDAVTIPEIEIPQVPPGRIDEINILQATYEAMREAVANLKVTPQLLLNDAVTIPEIEIPQVPIIKGDAKSVSIAAASIVAKVTRDRMMEEYDKLMPEYGFASNKGYGSQIIKGDAKSVSIAAASIVAKVTRDRMMEEYDKLMPEYGFASNKGYGSQSHIEALKKFGPTPIHRASFIKNFI